MNPLFMQMMMNSMGMGCSPFMGGMNFMMPSLFCGSGMMSMPYYQNDNLGFLNFPIFRNTSYDYLLDPNYSLQQCQAHWRNGGGVGSTMLPGFSFPGFSPITAVPGIPGFPGVSQQPQKTEAEKEAEKKKAEEAKKPAAKKAQKLNETFEKIKKLAEDKNNHFPEIPEELINKAEEAMKKGTAEEQYKAMKEVMAAIPEDTLRKTVLADDNVRNQLRKAGYNFNLARNKYSLKNSDIKEEDIDNAKRSIKLHNDTVEKKYNELQLVCGQLSDPNVAKARILGVISSWNDKYKGNESGILKSIAQNLPTGNDAVAKKAAVKDCVKAFTEALLLKASDYEGYDKITKARDEVNKKLNAVLQTSPEDGFTTANINSLAAACDKLYARLRMQEAVNIKDYINKNFKYLNDVKQGVITENMVIEETQKDLEAEGIAYPKVNDLDKAPLTEEIIIQNEEEMRNLDEEYKDDAKGMLDALVENGKLTKVAGKENVYQAKAVSGFIKYYGIVDNKVYEVFKGENNQFYKTENAEEVTAANIGSYDMAVTKANNLIKTEAIDALDLNCKYPVFKATCSNDYYIIKNNNFYHIANCNSISDIGENKIEVKFNDKEAVIIDALSNEDLEEVDTDSIKTKKQKEAEDKAKAEQDNKDKFNAVAKKYTKDKITLYTANTRPDSLGLEKTGVQGYFRNIPKDGEPTIYFKYDNDKKSATYQKLVPLYGVSKINPDGTMVEKGKSKICPEVQAPEKSAKDLQNILSDSSYKYRDFEKRKGSKEKVQEDLNAIKRKFNSFRLYKTVGEIMEFFNNYKEEAHHWLTSNDPNVAVAVYNNNAIPESDKKEYIKLLAVRLKQVVDKKQIAFDNPDDAITLESIARGEMVVHNYDSSDLGLTLGSTACELDRLIEIVLNKYNV